MAGLVESLIIGISLAAIPGPIFFELIRRTLARGFWAGAFLAAGEFLGNCVLFAFIYLGASTFLASALSKLVLYLAGALILMWLGAGAFRLTLEQVSGSYGKKLNDADSIIAGLSIALTSPIVIALWISPSGSYMSEFSSAMEAILNITLVSSGVLVFFLVLAAAIARTRHRIDEKYVVLLSKISGIILLLYGISFLYQFSQLLLSWNQ
jgi:putative LysE/RhtB family amino acid efflux pump